MIPIPLKEDLEKQLMKMPELEQEEEYINNVPDYQEEKELQDKLMEMPELEHNGEEYYDEYDKEELLMLVDKLQNANKRLVSEVQEYEVGEVYKSLHDINTFQAHENEVYLRGKDENGKDFQVVFDSYNFLEWIDTEHLEYIKKQLTKYIKTK